MIVGLTTDREYRWYVDPVTGEAYESVTAILGDTEAKPWLTPWSAKLAAIFAVDNHRLIGQIVAEQGPEAAVELVKVEAARQREIAAQIGTYQHDVLQALLLDEPIPDVPLHLLDVEVDGEIVDQDAISDGLLNFLNDFDVDPTLSEATVCNPLHRYAGTLDIHAYVGRLKGHGLIDLKSGKRVDPPARVQVKAYRECTEVWVDNMGNKVPMPHTDFGAVLHLRRSYHRGYKLYPADASDALFAWFLTLREVREVRRALPPVMGVPLYPALPDGSQPPPLLEDVHTDNFPHFRKALAAAGVLTLDELAALTEPELDVIDGVGPKAIEACKAVLARYGRALTPTPEREVA